MKTREKNVRQLTSRHDDELLSVPWTHSHKMWWAIYPQNLFSCLRVVCNFQEFSFSGFRRFIPRYYVYIMICFFERLRGRGHQNMFTFQELLWAWNEICTLTHAALSSFGLISHDIWKLYSRIELYIFEADPLKRRRAESHRTSKHFETERSDYKILLKLNKLIEYHD